MTTDYSTGNIDKGMALVTALVTAGFHVQMTTAGKSATATPSHIVFTTNATTAQFAGIRAALSDRFPSSNPNATLDMPDPDNVTVPDTLAEMWHDNMDD